MSVLMKMLFIMFLETGMTSLMLEKTFVGFFRGWLFRFEESSIERWITFNSF